MANRRSPPDENTVFEAIETALETLPESCRNDRNARTEVIASMSYVIQQYERDFARGDSSKTAAVSRKLDLRLGSIQSVRRVIEAEKKLLAEGLFHSVTETGALVPIKPGTQQAATWCQDFDTTLRVLNELTRHFTRSKGYWDEPAVKWQRHNNPAFKNLCAGLLVIYAAAIELEPREISVTKSTGTGVMRFMLAFLGTLWDDVSTDHIEYAVRTARKDFPEI